MGSNPGTGFRMDIFSHIFDVKIGLFVWKDENKWKRGLGWPIFYIKKSLHCSFLIIGSEEISNNYYYIFVITASFPFGHLTVIIRFKVNHIKAVKFWKVPKFFSKLWIETWRTWQIFMILGLKRSRFHWNYDSTNCWFISSNCSVLTVGNGYIS